MYDCLIIMLYFVVVWLSNLVDLNDKNSSIMFFDALYIYIYIKYIFYCSLFLMKIRNVNILTIQIYFIFCLNLIELWFLYIFLQFIDDNFINILVGELQNLKICDLNSEIYEI